MAKKTLRAAEKIYDADNDQVHYEADGHSGNVTLCGQTDWIGQTPGEETDKPVDCEACKSVVKFVLSHTFD